MLGIFLKSRFARDFFKTVLLIGLEHPFLDTLTFWSNNTNSFYERSETHASSSRLCFVRSVIFAAVGSDRILTYQLLTRESEICLEIQIVIWI